MHTKGPWVVQLEENDLEWVVMSGKYYVATCHDCAADGCTEDNAHLIAAAPILLAALERVVEESSHDRHCGAVFGPPNEGWIEEDKCDCFLKDAKAAIAKAKGE